MVWNVALTRSLVTYWAYVGKIALPTLAIIKLLKVFGFHNFQFLKDVVNAICHKTVEQPTVQEIRDQVLGAQRPVVTLPKAEQSLSTWSLIQPLQGARGDLAGKIENYVQN